MTIASSDQSSNPVFGFSMMEQVRICTVCPTENWLGTSKTTYRVGWMIWICYSRALERRCLLLTLSVQPQSPPQRTKERKEGRRKAMHKKYDITFAEREAGRSVAYHVHIVTFTAIFEQRRWGPKLGRRLCDPPLKWCRSVFVLVAGKSRKCWKKIW